MSPSMTDETPTPTPPTNDAGSACNAADRNSSRLSAEAFEGAQRVFNSGYPSEADAELRRLQGVNAVKFDPEVLPLPSPSTNPASSPPPPGLGPS
jgi:hypothetical protein